MAPHATPQRHLSLVDPGAHTVSHEPGTRAPDAPAFPFAPGAAVSGGRYQLIQLIGKGGMGWVFEAHDRERQQRVALKSLREPGPSREFRLKREFRALADLRHPNLVRMLELGREGDTSFITMELVDGVGFSSHVRPGPGAAPDVARLRAALPQLVSAVQALHAAGKLHGDLKPSNVLVDRDGRVVVLDFGLLHETASHLYAPEAGGAGTPGFMAPEQLRGRAIAASDWYSVGAMIYHALTRELPPSHDGIASAPADAPCADLTALQGLPPDLLSLALDLLQERAADRPGGEAIAARVGARTGELPATRVVAVDGLVGRAAELQRLRECLAQTQAGRPSRALVAGASGIGKTALVTAFLGEVVAQGAVVLSGKCHERDTVPYKALDTIVDELSRYLRKLPQEALAPLLPYELPALLQVFPVLGRLPLLASAARAEAHGLDPAHTRKRALHALKELLRRIGEQRTLVLFIDDLQWGDVDSARLLMHLMAPPDPPRMMLLAAYRSGEVGVGPAVDWLLAGSALPGDRSHTLQLAVEALSPEDSRELVGRLLQAPSSIRDALASESAGNPLFATELALAWLGRAHDPAADGGVPPAFSLSSLLGKRIAGLPAAAAELLELTVVAARPPRLDVLQHALPGGLAALWTAIDVLKAERFVTGQVSESCERIAPCHDRVREAIDLALDPARRTARHRQLADAVEAVTPDEHDVLLEHLLGAGRSRPAGECAARAGDAASQVLAFERAALFFEKARDLLAAPRAAELGIERKLAAVLAAAGRCNEAADVYLELVAHAQGRGERAELLRHAAVQALAGGSRETGIAAFQELFATLGLRWPSTARPGALEQLVQLLRCALLVAVALRRKEPKVQRESADQVAALFAASESLVRYEPRAAGRMTLSFVALALRGAGPSLRAHACAILGNVWLVTFGPGERVFRLLERARELAARTDDAHALAASRTSLSLAHMMVGRFAQGEALAEQAVRLTRSVPLARIAHENAQQLRISAYMWQGKLQAADRELTILLVNARETGHTLMRQQQRGADAQAALHADPQWQAMQAEPLLRHVGNLITPGRRWRWESWIDLLGALYRGDVARAAQLEAILQKDLIWGRMAHVQQLYVRGLIALAGPVPGLDPARRALALRMARALDKLKLTQGSAYAALLRAGVAAFDRQETAVRARLTDAASSFFACGMLLYAHCAQRALGRMDGGAAGAALIADADAFMHGQTVVDVERWTRSHVPGYDAVLALRAPAS